LWVLPLMSAGLALAVAEGVIYLLAKHAGLTVNAQSAGILTVLVFGAGTDYALLLVARYREELRKHDHPNEAMAVALHRAGPAVIASSLTVAAGMICLLVAELNSTKGLGPVCAIGVLVALGAMLTLLPALLTIFGRWSRWMFWPVKPRYGTPEPTERGLWARVGRASSHRPRIVWVVTALILGVMALGMLDLKAHGISNADSFVTEQDSIRGQKVLDAHFPAGIGDPLMALVNDSSAPAVASALAKVPGIADAKVVGSKGGYSLVDATLKDASDTPAAAKTVVAARTAAHAVPGADVKIAGTAAITYDVAHASTHDRKVIIPLILLVARSASCSTPWWSARCW
jgi:RND superfamily putative drug exporter